jgi:hypothetical protein
VWCVNFVQTAWMQLSGKFRNAGQTCVCVNRILVQDGKNRVQQATEYFLAFLLWWMIYGEYILLEVISSRLIGVLWDFGMKLYRRSWWLLTHNHWQCHMLDDRHLWRVCSSFFKGSTRVAGGEWTRSRGNPGSYPTPSNAGNCGYFAYMMLRFQLDVLYLMS